ncbi:hypothetical protein LTR84_011875 [Exophiala bonariae]|uniref:Zn(2)-C6 fungal-type domain-containing protein n=1 Tax=Exophiala bonariae TaxID=1690606 RepID=A0AAV9NLK5_9EURO|nr:hypothetical protein LTR84_011875 [Exophiala bonariae]
MAYERKNGFGCWTCRLRRKKCDGAKPKCRNCIALEITCHNEVVKPAWMDGGTRQKEMTSSIKTQIKRRAETRRERPVVQVTTVETGDSNFILESGQGLIFQDTQQNQSQTSDLFGANSRLEEGTVERMQWMGSVLSFLDEYEEVHDHLPILSRGRDFEIDFMMKYMDYVFPHLFPFYQPCLQETGRSWVLALLRRSRVAFHSAMSLSAFFFIAALIDVYPGQHDYCKSMLWEKVGRQADICFELIQHDIQELSLRGPQATVLEKARLMQSITQFLIFEVALSRSVNWNSHLTPALGLFEDIWQSTTLDASGSKLLAVLDAMTTNLRFGLDHGGYVWSPEQAGLRFFIGFLIYIDVIASTSLGQPARLIEHHGDLLAQPDNSEADFGFIPIRLSSLIGCQNWVLVTISQINLLDIWKKDKKKISSLSIMELVNRASGLVRTLDEGIARIEKSAPGPQKDHRLIFRSYVAGHAHTCASLSMAHTRIWAHAAHIYLAVVVSGWQPSNVEIRYSVSKILELLRTVDLSTHLRTLVWPLCVAGCISEAGRNEQEFRSLLSGMDELSMIGALGEAQKVMEKVWDERRNLDHEIWDFAMCFRILGEPVLLV